MPIKPTAIKLNESPNKGSESWGGDTNQYRTTLWLKLAKSHKQANPFCVECEKKGIVTPVEVTDHIIPVKKNPDLFYTWGNLQSLCNKCHNKKTAKENQRSKKI